MSFSLIFAFLGGSESDNGSDETRQYVKEEKKRKQMEAVAEDLFNNEKVRKKIVSTRLEES